MKTAIITGASSGLGQEMARQIDALIPNIEEFWLFARRKDRVKEFSESLTRPSKIFGWDLLSENAMKHYEKLLCKKEPEIVFLVNAAGFGKIGEVSYLSCEDQIGMIDLNVRVLTVLCRLSIPYLSAKSRIINFASAAAFLPQPHFAVYAASKSYVLSFSRALNAELREKGCFVTAVCPGPARTEFFTIAETNERLARYKRFFMSKPEKVAHKALYDSVLSESISVYGLPMKVFHVLAKLLPHDQLLKL